MALNSHLNRETYKLGLEETVDQIRKIDQQFRITQEHIGKLRRERQKAEMTGIDLAQYDKRLQDYDFISQNLQQSIKILETNRKTYRGIVDEIDGKVPNPEHYNP